MSNIKELKSSRYYGVIPINVISHRYSSVFASSTSPELIMAVPYSDLIEALKSHVDLDEKENPSALQQFRNYLSALNGFLAFCGKTVDGNIGLELSSSFDTRLRDYLASIQVSPRTRADRARQLKTLRRLYDQRETQRRSKKNQGTFTEQLRQHVAAADVSPKTLAKQAGVSPATLSRWLGGARPRPDTLPAVRRLESRLGLERDALVRLIDQVPPGDSIIPNVLAYRTRLVERTKRGLGLSEQELSESLLFEWWDFFKYKVSGFPSLERHGKGQWRMIPKSMSLTTSEFATRGLMACPSAEMFLQKLRHFLGVIIRLQPEMGGLSWASTPTQTMAFCAHPSALECYLQWLTDQSDGVRHKGQQVFASFMASLLRPNSGYLWQQPAQFRIKLPEEYRPKSDEEWQKMCEKSHKFLRDYIRGSTGVSRNPEEPIADLLALPNPFGPIRDAIKRIQEDAAESPPGGLVEARHKRNALLLSILLSNPLRIRTIASLTLLPNGQGSIRGNATSGWRIMLQSNQLKNGASKPQTYSVKVADWVKPLLDEYVEEYRDTLLAGKSSQYLFVGDKQGGVWKEMSKTILRLTRRYIPGSPGFGPHAFRHLVATNWLRKNPGDFLTVAELLNDSLATVLANYAHLRMDDSFARYEAQFAQSP